MSSPAQWSADVEGIAGRLDRIQHELDSLGRSSRRAYASVVWTDVARDALDQEVAQLDRDLGEIIADIARRSRGLRGCATRLSLR